MKKAYFVTLLIGVVLFAAGLTFPDLFPVEKITEYHLAQGAKCVAFASLTGGGVTILYGIAGVIFNKRIAQHCNWKTTTVTLGISAVTSLGAHCILSFLSCFFLTNPDRHPIRFPASLCVGMISLSIFLMLGYLYCQIRRKNASVGAVVMDVILGLAACIPFYFTYLALDYWISGMI